MGCRRLRSAGCPRSAVARGARAEPAEQGVPVAQVAPVAPEVLGAPGVQVAAVAEEEGVAEARR